MRRKTSGRRKALIVLTLIVGVLALATSILFSPRRPIYLQMRSDNRTRGSQVSSQYAYKVSRWNDILGMFTFSAPRIVTASINEDGTIQWAERPYMEELPAMSHNWLNQTIKGSIHIITFDPAGRTDLEGLLYDDGRVLTFVHSTSSSLSKLVESYYNELREAESMMWLYPKRRAPAPLRRATWSFVPQVAGLQPGTSLAPVDYEQGAIEWASIALLTSLSIFGIVKLTPLRRSHPTWHSPGPENNVQEQRQRHRTKRSLASLIVIAISICGISCVPVVLIALHASRAYVLAKRELSAAELKYFSTLSRGSQCWFDEMYLPDFRILPHSLRQRMRSWVARGGAVQRKSYVCVDGQKLSRHGREHLYTIIAYAPPVHFANEGTVVAMLNTQTLEAYVIWMTLSEFQKALAETTKRIGDDPDKTRLSVVKAYYNRGKVYAAKRSYDAAISDYTRAIEAHPEYAVAYFDRAFAYRHKKHHIQAIKDLHKARSLGYRVGPRVLETFRKSAEDEE